MRFRCLLVSALSLSVASAIAQPLPKAEVFPIERYYQYPLINGRSPSAPQMSPDGTKIAFGWNNTGVRRLDLWIMDYPSGNRRSIVEAKSITDLPRQEDTRTDLEKTEAEL